MTIGRSNEPPPPTSHRSSSDKQTAAQTNTSASDVFTFHRSRGLLHQRLGQRQCAA